MVMLQNKFKSHSLSGHTAALSTVSDTKKMEIVISCWFYSGQYCSDAHEMEIVI